VGISPHLSRAYELARSHHPHPNPRVGAVVVSPDGRVLGEGAHEGPGKPHAEVAALDAAGSVRGATVYVSLEPCSHVGNTPACADRLVADGVARVVVGATDPDPRVSGAGISRLRSAGIDVDVVEDPAARAVDAAYFHHRETGLPLVTIKYAMTLDGSAAARDASSQWITSKEARADAHALRAESDAVVVGAGTLAGDDPALDVRLPGYEGPQPRPVVVAGTGELATGARLWRRDPLVLSTRELAIPSGTLVVVDGGEHPDPVEACRALAGLGLISVLLEGGPTIAAGWWQAGVVSRGVVYIGGRVGGGTGMQPLNGVFSTIDDATDVVITGARALGPDVRIDFELEP